MARETRPHVVQQQFQDLRDLAMLEFTEMTVAAKLSK